MGVEGGKEGDRGGCEERLSFLICVSNKGRSAIFLFILFMLVCLLKKPPYCFP